MLIRFAKRLTAWDQSVEEVIEYDFADEETAGLDHRPSLYEVDESALIRVRAEHCATTVDPRPKDFGVVADGFATTEEVKESDHFAFARAAHREADLPTAAAVRTFVEKLWEAAKSSGRRPFVRNDVRTYARGRFAARDIEWDSVCEHDKVKEWVLKAKSTCNTAAGDS